MKKSPNGSIVAPTRKRATLRTISQLTGLSQSTVSLSLRGGAAIKEETRGRVAEAAAQVSYVPDRAVVRCRINGEAGETLRTLGEPEVHWRSGEPDERG